ncbi:MAG: spermidine synthase [Acidimicrobiia bacterium]|nr:spermidine synthase [Acidimicrobiia bacterium]
MRDVSEPHGETFVVDQRDTPHGLVVLRSCGPHFEIISDGMFLMDTRNGGSERLLVAAALASAERPQSVLLGGLGVGFSLAEALDSNGIEHVTVVELHETIIEWNFTHFSAWMGQRFADERLTIVCDDLANWVLSGDRQFSAICLDVDNGPTWLSVPSNTALYDQKGIAALARRLLPGGVLGIWSADRAIELESTLRHNFEDVSCVEVPVPRGAPDVIYLATRVQTPEGPAPPE